MMAPEAEVEEISGTIPFSKSNAIELSNGVDSTAENLSSKQISFLEYLDAILQQTIEGTCKDWDSM